MKIAPNYFSLNNTYIFKQKGVLPLQSKCRVSQNSDVCSKEAAQCLKSLAFGSRRSEFLSQIDRKNEYVKNTLMKNAKNFALEVKDPIALSEQMHTNHSGYEQVIYGRDMHGDVVKEYIITKDPLEINTLCADDITEGKKGIFRNGKLIEYQEGIFDEDEKVCMQRDLLLSGNKPDSYSENETFEQDESGEFTIKSDFELLYDKNGTLSNCFINPVRYNSIDIYPDDFDLNVVYSDGKPLYICNSLS